MRTTATFDAGYSPLLRDTIVAGREYDLPDTEEIPGFLEAAPQDAPEPVSPWTYTDTSEAATDTPEGENE